VLDLMTASGVPSNDITFTCLIEAAVLSGEVEMAQRVFARAMAAGVTHSVQVCRCERVGRLGAAAAAGLCVASGLPGLTLALCGA
jgi:hypothetical protein